MDSEQRPKRLRLQSMPSLPSWVSPSYVGEVAAKGNLDTDFEFQALELAIVVSRAMKKFREDFHGQFFFCLDAAPGVKGAPTPTLIL